MVKKLIVLLAVVATLALAIIPAAAEGTGFTDGRLNSWEMDAPLAVYYTTEPQLVLDDNGYPRWSDGEMVYEDVIVSLDIWGLVPGTENVEHVLNVPIDELNNMVATATGDISVEGLYGYTLGYSPTSGGWFWASAPADSSGNVYTFQWQAE